jgi:hypothetical protein
MSMVKAKAKAWVQRTREGDKCKEQVERDIKEVSRSNERYFVRVSRAEKTRDECRRLYLLGL